MFQSTITGRLREVQVIDRHRQNDYTALNDANAI